LAFGVWGSFTQFAFLFLNLNINLQLNLPYCTFARMRFPLVLQSILLQQEQIKLYVPDGKAVRDAYEKRSIPFPYWSRVWPSAIALAGFLLQHPHYTKKKKVVELGAGLGLPSLIAANNAIHVLCTDMMAEAVAVVQQSIAYLHLQNVAAEVLDWRHLPQDMEADVLLLSDINYEPAAFALLQEVMALFLQRGTTIILSTPQRLMAKDFIAPLLVDCTKQEELTVSHNSENVAITVVVLEKKNVSL
jgi:predicted nicotinamide N-methyase